MLREGIADKEKNLISDLKLKLDEAKRKIGMYGGIAGKDLVKLKECLSEKEDVIGQMIEARKTKRDKKEKYDEIVENVMRNSEIICCTLNSAGSEKLERYEQFIEAIVVDEAAQCTEPTNVIPLKFKANKLVLIGDPQQLPATTFSKDSFATLYNRSLFEVKQFFYR